MKPLIKICGMRDTKNIAEIDDLNPNFLGFIFIEKSKRFVGKEFVMPNSKAQKMAVFADEKKEIILQIANQYQLQWLQFHGNESPEFCAYFQKMGFSIVKAFALDDDFDFESLFPYQNKIKFLLFDAKGKEKGGNGIHFNWAILKKYQGETPFFLSGGLSLDDVEDLKKIQHEKLIGYDLNSKFELDFGSKDKEKVHLFVQNFQ